MTTPIIVNQSTTLVQVDTSLLLAPYIVLLSNLNSPGSLLTIRDSTGNASLTNNIVISTTVGVNYLDGGGPRSNIYTINQPYGFLSITPKTSNIWGVVNTFAFPDASASANLNLLNVSSMNVSTIGYIQRANISTALISTLCTVNVFIQNNLSVGESTIAHAGFYTCSIRSLQDIIGASDIYAGSTLSSMFANITSTLTVPYISTQNVFVYGGLQTASSISTSGPMFVGSSISTTGNLAVGASTFIQGQLTVLQAAFFNSSISTKGALNVGYETILNSSLTVASISTLSNMTVCGSLSVMSTLYTRWNSYHESSILASGSFSTLEDVNIRRNLSTLGNVFIGKEVFTRSSMLITGAISTLHDINVRSNVSILGNLYVKGDVVFDDNQINLQDIIASSIYTQYNISTMSSLIAGGFLNVNGSTLLGGTVSTLSNFNIRGLLSTASSIIVGDSLNVFNTGFFGSNISTPSSIGIGNSLNVGGPTNLQGFLSTFGQSAFYSSMQIQGSVSVMSSMVISSNLDVGNTLTAINMRLNGSTFISTLAVTNTFGFALNISSSTLHHGLFSTSGAMNIGGLISTTNALIVGSTINTQLLAVRSGMSVFSDAGFAQDIYARSSVIIGMSTILRGPLFTQSPAYLADALFTSNVVLGIPNFSGDSPVSFTNNGSAYIKGNVTVNTGILQLSNILKIAAPVIGTTTNTISNDTDMNNLNVTGLTRTTNVGIFTANPSAQLDIRGGGNSSGIGAGGSNLIAFQWSGGGLRHLIRSRHAGTTVAINTNAIDFWLNTSSSTDGSATTIAGTGNVNTLSVTAAGIGISCNAPGYALDVNGTTNLNGAVRFKTGTQHISDDGIQRFWYVPNGTTYYSSGDGTHTFQNSTRDTTTFAIDNLGNLTSRGSTFYFGGNSTSNLIRFYGTTGDQPGSNTNTVIGEYLYGASQKSELILFKANDSNTTDGRDRVRVLSSGGFQVDINGEFAWADGQPPPAASIEGAFCVVPSGNVGIRTTSPAYALDVNGTANFILKTGGPDWYNSSDGKKRFNFDPNGITYFGSPNGYEFRDSADARKVSIDNTGNITTLAAIKTSSGIFVRSNAGFTDTMNGAPSYGIGEATIPVGGTVQIAGYYGINFVGGGSWAQGSSHMVIRDGNVGIRTTSPAYLLDVSGTMNVGGATTIGGTLNVTGLTTLSNSSNTGTLGVAGLTTFSSNVGIFTTSTSAPLDILGGRDANSITGTNLIAFQYRTGGYRHFITSRHYGDVVNYTENAIDFWLNKSNSPTGSSTGGTGNINTLSVTAAGIGIYCNAPQYALDVNGTINCTGYRLNGAVLTTSIAGINSTGNVGINKASNDLYSLDVSGDTYLNGVVRFKRMIYHKSDDNAWRFFFENNANTFFGSHTGYVFRTGSLNGDGTDILSIGSTGNLLTAGKITATGKIRSMVNVDYFNVSDFAGGWAQLTVSQNNDSGGVLCLGNAFTDNGGSASVIQSGIQTNSVTTNLLINPKGGAVGIGTVSPGYALDVNGSINCTGYRLNGAVLTTSIAGINSTGNVGINKGSNPSFALDVGGDARFCSTGGGMRFRDGVTSPYAGYFVFGDGSGWRVRFGNYNAPTLDVFDNLTGINVTGDITASRNITATGDVTAGSDKRYKENIVTIDSALDKVTSMRGVYFTRKESPERHVGVIAQEMEEILPEVVHTDSSEEKMKSVSYGNITAVLIEAIKEQQVIINAQQSTINGILYKFSTLQQI